MRKELEIAFDYLESYAEKLKPFMKWYVENTGVNIEKQFADKEVEEYRNAIN